MKLWQDGYGAFSVNPSEVDTVIAYITNQHEHHRKKAWQPTGRETKQHQGKKEKGPYFDTLKEGQ